MYSYETEQKVYEVGGVKFGGQPGDYPTVVCNSIFQKGDRVFEGKRKEGFNEKRAEEVLKKQDQLWEETGIPGMADIVANKGDEFKTYIDFLTSVSDMPFCIDAWVLKPKLEAAAYCAEKGLLDRMFYNSITVWEKELETEIKEVYNMGIKHVLLVGFDDQDLMPSGRITGLQRLFDALEKVGASFETIIVDTATMNAPATAMCAEANRLIKDKWGVAVSSAPSNGSYIWKEAREKWGFKGWAATDSALEGLAAFHNHDMIFSGPMGGVDRVMPAVAMAEACLATAVFSTERRLPKEENHPLYKLFPDFVDQLKSL